MVKIKPDCGTFVVCARKADQERRMDIASRRVVIVGEFNEVRG